MGSIRITEFGGIKPRDVRSYGPPSRASIAEDVKLWHGNLEPWRYPSLEIETNHDKLCVIDQFDCCFVGSENDCANFTRPDNTCKRIFSTDVMPWPAYATLDDNCLCDNNCGSFVEPDWCRLGVPAPVNAPSVSNFTLTDAIDDCSNCEHHWQNKRESRAYLYTFVNEYGEESNPSPISNVYDIDIDSPARLGFSIRPLDDGFCNPVYIRIYRAGSGFNPEGNWDKSTASFFYVADIDYRSGNFTFTDDITPDCLGESLEHDCNTPPLQCLKNITSTDHGVLVASEGKNLWFSEPWKFHAWACKINLDDCIEAITVMEPYIYVATKGHAYVISTQNNEDDCSCCRTIHKMGEPAPITCKRSMVKTHNGVMWASNTGLVQMVGNQMQIDTHPYMAEDDWQEWFPSDLTGVYYKGQYFGFNRSRGFIWDFTDGIYSDSYLGDSGKFTTLSLTPDAVFRSDQNFLFLTIDGDIYRWDNSDTYIPYKWRSKLHVEGGLKNFSIMKVVFEDYLRTHQAPRGVNIKLFSDDNLVFNRKVTCSRPFRLPKGYDGLSYEIEVTGTQPVMEIHMATSKQELILLNNA